jgi:hypothetical protein
MTSDNNWSFQLDWLNILNILGITKIEQISKSKKAKALKRVSKVYGAELLNTMKPEELDQIVANELRSLMKRELNEISKRNEKIEKEIQNKMLPLKKGRVIGINMSDLRDLDPKADIEDIIKYFSKKLSDNDDDDDADDEDGGPDEDKNGIYI